MTEHSPPPEHRHRHPHLFATVRAAAASHPLAHRLPRFPASGTNAAFTQELAARPCCVCEHEIGYDSPFWFATPYGKDVRHANCPAVLPLSAADLAATPPAPSPRAPATGTTPGKVRRALCAEGGGSERAVRA